MCEIYVNEKFYLAAFSICCYFDENDKNIYLTSFFLFGFFFNYLFSFNCILKQVSIIMKIFEDGKLYFNLI